MCKSNEIGFNLTYRYISTVRGPEGVLEASRPEVRGAAQQTQGTTDWGAVFPYVPPPRAVSLGAVDEGRTVDVVVVGAEGGPLRWAQAVIRFSVHDVRIDGETVAFSTAAHLEIIVLWIIDLP